MIRLRSKLKEWFSAGKRPTGEQFADLIDSFYHKTEDALPTNDLSAFAQALDNKADKGHTHAVSEVEGLYETLGDKADAEHTHQMSEVEGLDEALEGKADQATTLAGYHIDDAYTKTETDAKLGTKADKATTLAGYHIDDAYTKTETDALLNDKADKTHTHAIADVTGQAAYLTKVYRSGFNWYRIYSDGWVEQGGRVAVKEATSTTVTLHQKMKDNSYSVMVTNNCVHTARDAEGTLTATIASVTEIKIHAGYINPNSTNAFWEVRGMKA